MTGPAGEVIDAYLNSISQENPFFCENPDYGLTIEKVALKNKRSARNVESFPRVRT